LSGLRPENDDGVYQEVMRTSTNLLLAMTFVLAASAAGLAEVEWHTVERLALDSVPRDVSVTHDGQTLYILTEKGDILVYSQDGALKDTIKIGPHADSIEIGQDGDVLYVISRQKKTVETVQLDFIHSINTEGSPFKGPENAPVVIAVFSDFQ
jgi:hypothetical protein